MLGDRGAERPGHDRAGDPGMGAQMQHVPGMIIQPADDLGTGTAASGSG